MLQCAPDIRYKYTLLKVQFFLEKVYNYVHMKWLSRYIYKKEINFLNNKTQFMYIEIRSYQLFGKDEMNLLAVFPLSKCSYFLQCMPHIWSMVIENKLNYLRFS